MYLEAILEVSSTIYGTELGDVVGINYPQWREARNSEARCYVQRRAIHNGRLDWLTEPMICGHTIHGGDKSLKEIDAGSTKPSTRYGHTAIAFDEKLHVFGGYQTTDSDIWGYQVFEMPSIALCTAQNRVMENPAA